jgi:hypothetical protein
VIGNRIGDRTSAQAIADPRSIADRPARWPDRRWPFAIADLCHKAYRRS